MQKNHLQLDMHITCISTHTNIIKLSKNKLFLSVLLRKWRIKEAAILILTRNIGQVAET